eukprot:g38883.t1
MLALEGLQKKITRMTLETKGLSYEEQLRTMGLYSMEFRRMRRDLIETYRILRGLDSVDVENMFALVGEARIQGHSLKVKGQLFRTEMSRNIFNQRLLIC